MGRVLHPSGSLSLSLFYGPAWLNIKPTRNSSRPANDAVHKPHDLHHNAVERRKIKSNTTIEHHDTFCFGCFILEWNVAFIEISIFRNL